MRPCTLRPSVFDCFTISGQYGSPLCSSGVTTLTSARRPGEVGLTFTSGIASHLPLLRRREINFLAHGEPHIGLLPVAPATLDAAEAARLALDVGHGHRVDLGLEHQLDRRLDLRLGRVVGDTEHVLAVLVGNEGALLRHDRGEHDGHQALGAVLLRRRHFSISSSFATAAFVRSTLRKRTNATGLAWRTVITSTFGRLRDDRSRFWSISSVMTSTPSKPIDLTFCASNLVFGCSTRNSSTTRMRSSRASCDRIEQSPARYILRFTLCEKFSSGEFGKILPPPRHSGLEVMPARARPVPFCRQGFLVEWLTAPRSFCARVPRRAFAWNATTIWCTSASLKSRANSASGALKVPAAPLSFTILSSMARSAQRFFASGCGAGVAGLAGCGAAFGAAAFGAAALGAWTTGLETLTAGRTSTSRPLEPGTEPLTSRSCLSASTRTISRFRIVRRTSPRWPAMRLPGNTRAGLWFWPVEPGLLCEIELPWLARLDEKWWRLISPAKPLPIVMPWTSTFWPTLKISTPILPPTFRSARSSALARNSRSVWPASTPALARCPATALLTRLARRLPNATWTAA